VDRSFVLYQLSLALARAGRDTEAKTVLAEMQLRQALALWSEDRQRDTNAALQSRVVEACVAAGKSDDAVKFLHDILGRKPDAAGTRLLLADCYESQGRPDRAKEERRQAGPGAITMPTAPPNFRWAIAALGSVTGAVLMALIWYASRSSQPAPPQPTQAMFEPTPGLPWFVDVTHASGISFRHFDPATPAQYIQETLGSGLAWIDYNNDGWPDLFVVQDGPVQPGAVSRPGGHE